MGVSRWPPRRPGGALVRSHRGVPGLSLSFLPKRTQAPKGSAADPPVAPASTKPGAGRLVAGSLLLLALVLALVAASLAFGARDIPLGTVMRTLLGQGAPDAYSTAVIFDERLPRTVLGLLVGLSLGGAGVIMQAITRNALADPGILGVEQGAALAVVVGIMFAGLSGADQYFWFALGGAAGAAALVYGISRRVTSASTEVGLVIAGAASAAFLTALVTLMIVRDEVTFLHYRYWSIGQLTGRASVIEEVWPFVVIALAAAIPLGRTLNALALDDDVAAGLGVRVGRAQLVAAAVGVLLCAAATAAVGPVGFVGLVGAHLARLLVGADHRWLLPYGMCCGAALLLAADVAGRLAPGNGEVEVGVMTAAVGTPFFVYLARRRRLVRA